MAYTINLTNGTVFATINDGTINQIASGTPSVPLITLVGKNYAGYGAFLDSNFVHLLESGSNSVAPTAPLTGQLWWDSTNNILKIYSGTGFKSITGATSSASAPTTTVIAGDLWFDTSNQQLKVYTGSAWLVVGPGYTSAQGTSGAIPETILNSVGATKYITSLYVNNTRVGVVYDGASFTPQVSLQTAFPTIYPGLTLSASVSGAVFAGSATNAQLLDSLDSSDFMRATANTATTGRLQVNNANGIYIGTSNVVNISQSTNDGLITAAVSGGNLIIQTNVAGTTYNVARALGASGTFAISNAATVGTTLSVTGNVTGGNLITAAAISAASVSASANVTGGNLNAGTGNISSTGNVIAGNIISAGVIAISNTSNTSISTSGNVQGSYFYGNGSQLTGLSLGVTVTKFVNGTTEGNAGTSGGNINFNVGGVSNVLVLTTGTAYFVGTANVTGLDKSGTNAVGNIGSSINYFNTMFAATYNGVTVSATGNVTGANVNTAALNATGDVTFSGDAENIAIGTSQTTGTLALGGTAQTGTLTIGQTTDSQTTNIQTGATATLKTKAINIGTGGLAGSTTTIAIGPVSATTAAATTTFNTATTVAIANTSGTALSVAGNITGGNVLGGANVNATTHTGTTVSVTGTITGGNLAVGTGTISTSGNVTGGNVLFGSGVVSGSGNITGGNLNAAGLSLSSNVVSALNLSSSLTAATTISAVGNITGGNVLGGALVNATTHTGTTVSVTGTITGGNLAVGTGTISTSGNITGGNVLGGALVNATSFTGTTVSVSGNITGGNLNAAGLSLSSNVVSALNVTSNIAGGNLLTPGLISATGTITGGNLAVGTGTISTSGNITGGNVLGGALVNATSFTGTTVSVSGNITGGNVLGGALVNATTHTGTTVSVTGNITGGNVLGGALVNATTHTGTTVSVTGNVTAANFIGNVTVPAGSAVSTTGNITGGNISTAGLLSASNNLIINSPSPQAEGAQIILAWANISGLTGQANSTWNIDSDSAATNQFRIYYQNATGSTAVPLTISPTTNAVNLIGALSAVGNITGGNVLGGALVDATTHTGTTVSVTGNITGGNVTVGTGTVTLGNIVNSNSTGVGNVGSSTVGFNTIFAKATSAQYADLAERYAADEVLTPGTVVDLGGTHEITRSQQDLSDAVFGVISTSAAYMMNNGAGSDATHPLVAIAGRVPVKVLGTVQKGDRLVSAGNGVARAAQPGEATWVNVIGRALENKTTTELGMIEATVSVK